MEKKQTQRLRAARNDDTRVTTGGRRDTDRSAAQVLLHGGSAALLREVVSIVCHRLWRHGQGKVLEVETRKSGRGSLVASGVN